jgi:hypothetical protein
MYYVPTGRKRVRRDGVEEDVVSVRHALRGDTVDIPLEQDIERGERTGSFQPDEIEQASPVAEEQTTGLPFDDHDALVEWFKEEQPTVTTVISAAEDDPDKARALLAAENAATGTQPRKGVSTGLNRIINQSEPDEED